LLIYANEGECEGEFTIQLSKTKKIDTSLLHNVELWISFTSIMLNYFIALIKNLRLKLKTDNRLK
jgi:hypothetical protein